MPPLIPPPPRFLAMTTLLLTTACRLLFLFPDGAHGFAAWFVDRRISCMSDLGPGEIIMNNAVLPHASSREPTVRVEVSPLLGSGGGEDAGPGSEHVAKFVIPTDARSRIPDAQFVMEMRGATGGASSSVPAKFTTMPSGGGIGCDGRRAHGKAAGDDEGSTFAVFTIDADATGGSALRIVAGWATGHEAVTLTEEVVVFVGRGVASSGGIDNRDDDALADDRAEAELEEEFIEEERLDLEAEIENAEEDAVEALEEKRGEIGDGSANLAIEDAEGGIVGALEVEREDVHQALDSLREEIESRHAEDHMGKHEGVEAHTEAQRKEAVRLHRIKHERKDVMEDRMHEMRRRFDKGGRGKNDARKDKLDNVMDLRGALMDSVKKLHKMDKTEHDKARREHIKPRIPDKEGMKGLIQKARDAFRKTHESIRDRPPAAAGGGGGSATAAGGASSGGGTVRGGGDAGYHGDVGTPLHPVARAVIQCAFALFGLCGLASWHLEKRRKAMKGRRNL